MIGLRGKQRMVAGSRRDFSRHDSPSPVHGTSGDKRMLYTACTHKAATHGLEEGGQPQKRRGRAFQDMAPNRNILEPALPDTRCVNPSCLSSIS